MSEAAVSPPKGNPRHKWYIVHAYSNFEKKVAESIREQAKNQGLEENFSGFWSRPKTWWRSAAAGR